MSSPRSELVNTAQKRLEVLRFFAHQAPKLPMFAQRPRFPWGGVYLELPKLELELLGEDAPPLVEEHFRAALEHIRKRLDCCDFSMAALLRMLYRYPDSRLLSDQLRAEIGEAVVGHIYWVDEPGEEHMCFCTENHQIIHHTNELLAGQLFPERTFTNNGRSGRWHREHAERMIDRWLDWRIRFGYSEWNSNCYYDEDLMALPNLVDYAENPSFRQRACGLLDLTLFHLAVNSFEGVFGSTHGRTYSRMTLNPRRENTSALAYVHWGLGEYRESLSASALMMCTCSYRVPPVLQSIALDRPPEMENLERHSLNVEDALDHGVDPASLDDIGFFWGAQVFDHRRVIQTSLELCPEKHGMYPRFKAFYDHQAECDRLGIPYDPDPDNTAMTQVDIYTYRTPDYMLSCAQDYRKGKHGFQQHIWQATLSDRAVVYTTHPGAPDVGRSRPDYWHGNGFMPRAAAYRNVLVCIYRFDPALSHMWFTHAYFPQHAFDEVRELGGWVFGRHGDGYVALLSMNPMRWEDPRPDVNALIRPVGVDEDLSPLAPYELVALGPKNVWICELGNPSTHGSFDDFCRQVAKASVSGDPLAMEYVSPSVGRVEFGWEGPLTVDGQEVSLHDYPRFGNPYCHAPWDTRQFLIRHNDLELALNLGSEYHRHMT